MSNINKKNIETEKPEEKDDENEEELYTLREAISGIVKGNESFIDNFIQENKEKINEYIKNNKEKIQKTFGDTSKFLDNLSEQLQKNIFQKFDKLKSDVINTTTTVASEVVVTAGLSEEQAAATLAIQVLGKVNEQIEEIIKNKNIQNLVNKILFLNQYVSGNIGNIQKLVRNYMDVIFSPLIMSNRVLFDNIMLYIKKIIILYQKIPQIKIQNAQKLMSIIDDGIKNNILTKEQKDKLAVLITSQLMELNDITKRDPSSLNASLTFDKSPIQDKGEPDNIDNNNPKPKYYNNPKQKNYNNNNNSKNKKNITIVGGNNNYVKNNNNNNKTKKIMENIHNSLKQYKMLNFSKNNKNSKNNHNNNKTNKRRKWK